MKPKKNNKGVKKNKIITKQKKMKYKIKISHLFGWVLIIFLCSVPLAPFILFVFNNFSK
ncbi:putative membrane protein [Candidatus Phytoplasma solani]